ncbi:adenylate/guanylate cyclase domain-containing protein [Bradyrhizobium sp. AZCC 2289]|uniref:adenylate/guanylate cyclase domain-containing protein n=1 Tax=Bradyrhizobium sp. AZCC 2289 TaxID=3117026 RepID=UPI002FF0E23B
MTGERVVRRLAAVLAADVVGYSRLMGRDENGTLTRLKAHRTERLEPMLARHGGRLVKLTGDGALVEFSSAVDALGAAIEFQEAMTEANKVQPKDTAIVFRVGLHLGDLIVDGDDLYGDGVNVAARLEAEAPPGGIVISGNMHDAVAGRLNANFDDLGALSLKNIERPVQAFGVRWEPSDWKVLASPAAATSNSAASLAAEAPLALPNKPSIAVLPFQNMSGDPEQEYFADGMVEDIITGLSRIKWLFVIARNSTFTYKGKPIDVKQVGRDLGVRYVLEGSVRKLGNRVRITSQLIDATNAAHVWAERYERALNDVFVLQDELTMSVVGAIEPSLRQAEIERARRKRPDSLDAYDLYLRALPDAFSGMPELSAKALPLLERAIAIDPDYAIAHAAIALCHHSRYQRAGWREEDKLAALRHARIAIAAADDATALGAAAFVVGSEDRDYDTAFNAFNRALASSPSSFVALSFGSMIYGWAGDYATAVEYGERAIRLSPFDAALHLPYNGLAYAHYFAGEFEEAALAASRSAQANPRFGPPWVVRVAALAVLGREDEAQASARRLYELLPNFTVTRLMASDFSSLEHRAMLAKGLRRAGVPE